jgi:hypothetical protein
VLEGSVRRLGGTVRVNAQLIDAGTGAHLWAEQIDVAHSTLAIPQDNFGIANRLARMLSVELVHVEGRRPPRADPDADYRGSTSGWVARQLTGLRRWLPCPCPADPPAAIQNTKDSEWTSRFW